MNVHKNAPLTPRGREWIVELDASGQTPKAISEAVGGEFAKKIGLGRTASSSGRRRKG